MKKHLGKILKLQKSIEIHTFSKECVVVFSVSILIILPMHVCVVLIASKRLSYMLNIFPFSINQQQQQKINYISFISMRLQQ